VCRVCDSLNYRSPAQRPASAVQHKLVLVTGRTVVTGGARSCVGQSGSGRDRLRQIFANFAHFLFLNHRQKSDGVKAFWW
jgi:hypothetical protein